MLHLFTRDGKTFTFNNVTDFTYNESMLTFSFTAKSDGKKKTGTFFVQNLAGFTRT